MKAQNLLIALSLTSAMFASAVARPGQAAPPVEGVPEMLAAQIRLQGFACEKALRASRDARRSKPDHEVWVLKCNNASYRVSRAPDMAADVKRLR